MVLSAKHDGRRRTPVRCETTKLKVMRMKRIVRCHLLALLLIIALSGVSRAQFGVAISVRIGPPPLPVYSQPLCPGPGYIWTPGYWAWDDEDGYYWVPGTWVLAPVGELWTPGYWGWNDGLYSWNDGYWGPHIGFYGGINYGFGYTGDGFYGGYWEGDRFFYNRSVNNVNVTNITNVYNKTVIVKNNTHVSYNGGNGGVRARPTPQQEAAVHERHRPAIGPQVQHQQAAKGNRQLFASVNHGRPAVAATPHPADFSHAVPARAAGGAYRAPKISPRRAVANRSGRQNGTLGSTNPRPSNPRPSNPPSSESNRSQAAPTRNSSRPDVLRDTSPATRPNENRTRADRPGENRPAAGSRPPASSRPVSPRTERAPVQQNDRPSSSSHAPSSPRGESAPPPRQSHPSQSQREAAAAPSREAAPARRESPPPQREVAPARRVSPPPQREAAPARRENPPAPHESAPPNRENAPKQDRKPPGKGR